MIKFRHSSFESTEKDSDFQIHDDETLDKAVSRVLENVDLGEFDIVDVYQASVNGNKIDHDFWPFTKLAPTDTVIISPVINKGEGGQIFKQFLVVVISAVATVFLSPAVGGGIYGALAVAVVTIGASLILNALIPPPVAENDLSAGGTLADSQMYTIASQSNQVKKFGTVPKVYGTHRVFPTIAANPYTELEVDPQTGKNVQYLYSLYDFGLGPLSIEEIKIGDTPIGDFSDLNYRLIDFNKPAVNEGPWDEVLERNTLWYRGDLETDSVTLRLDKNQTDGSYVDTYQAVRSSAVNTDSSNMQISLAFVNPSGLYGYSANGSVLQRTIDLRIEFAPFGTNDWKGFNDLSVVSNFETSGSAIQFASGSGESNSFDFGMDAPDVLPGPPSTSWYQVLRTYQGFAVRYNYTYMKWPAQRSTVFVYGYAAGTRDIYIKNSAFLTVGAPFRYNGQIIGTVESMTVVTGRNDVTRVRLTAGIPYALEMWLWETYTGRTVYWTDSNDGSQESQFLAGYSDWYYKGSNYSSTNIPSASNVFTSYTNALGRARISRADTDAVYSIFKFNPKQPGQYQVRVTRSVTSGDFYTSPDGRAQKQDALEWSAITTRFDRIPIKTDLRHVFLELRAKATNQFNGTIGNLSARVTSILDTYVEDTWVKQPTSNPAWIVADLLTGEINKRAIPKSRLHTESLVEWADFCDEIPTAPPGSQYFYPRAQCNFVLDYGTTLQQVIAQVAGSAQASLNIVDSKYGVLIDKRRDIPVQIFTTRNSKDFSSSRNYAARPDAVSVKYIDPSLDWGLAEITAYDNGFNSNNVENIDELTAFACTNHEQAWRFGRYMIAQNRYRQENMQLTVDWEFLVCSRGDYVQIAQDVMKVGGTPARVKSVVGNTITIDDAIVVVDEWDYGYVYRSAYGEIKTSTCEVVDARTFKVDPDALPSVGDMIIIGEVGKEVYDCIVKSISPNDDLSAVLTLVERADEIFDYESTDVFSEYQAKLVSATDSAKPPAKVEALVVADNFYQCVNGAYQYYIDLDWDQPGRSAYEMFQIYVDNGTGLTEYATTRLSMYRYIVPIADLGKQHLFKVIAVSAQGRKLDFIETDTLTVTPVRKMTPPSDIEALHIDITGEVIQLFWTPVLDCDVQEYLIRYSPLTNGGSWENSVPLLRAANNASLVATQARTGTYFIKARDFNGNESAIASSAITTIPNLFNLNVIEEVSDPDFTGARENVVNLATSVILEKVPNSPDYYAEGFYYYSQIIDLGEVYTSRIQSQIQVEGYTSEDLMSDWMSLDTVLTLSNSMQSDWDVETQYRATDQLQTMAGWSDLTGVDALDAGVTDNFTPWRKFVIGDVTGRVLQFRLRLISYKPNVTPRVYNASIRVDMPDRIESYENRISGIGGYTVTHAPAFAGPGVSPSIQVSIDDAESGDYWKIDSKSLDGFVIRFYNKNDVEVSRQFDVLVKGYGRKSDAAI